jgi:DNA repair protein RadD
VNKTLHAHQNRAIALLKHSLGTGRNRPVVQAPTGFGKTVLAAAIVEGALAKGKRIMFVVPAISLIDQTVQSFWNEGIRQIGVVQADHPMTNYGMPVQVVSAQTIGRRERLPEVDVVVIDECHRWFKYYETWMQDWNKVPFIGLSATPWTKGMGKHFNDLVIASTTQELIDSGYLSAFRVFAPSHPDLSKVRTVAGDYHEGDLGEVMNDSQLVSDCVNTWLAKGENRPTLCFAVNCAHAKKLQSDFLAAGVTAGYIDAFTKLEERSLIAKQFQQGILKVVCNVGCLTTGIDWDVRCIILARPTKSEMLFVQMIGRGLRTAEGKKDCLILDHSDTHLRLGFVTDIHHEKLDDGKKKETSATERKEPLPKECGKCGILKPAKVHKCPACGFKPEMQSQIEHVEGDLAEMSSSERRKAKLNRETSLDSKEQFLGELVSYAKEHGYKSGWAANQYREKFGVWPNRVQPADVGIIGFATQDWIRSKQIRYAKSKAKQAQVAA